MSGLRDRLGLEPLRAEREPAKLGGSLQTVAAVPSRYLTREEADALFGRKKPKRSKYAAKRTEVDGITFDSGKEARRYTELRNLARAGAIRELELQPRYPITIDGRPLCIRSRGFSKKGRQVVYVADFRYRDATGAQIVEDVKGLDTPTARLKRALVEHLYGITLTVIGGSYRSDKKRRKP